MKTSPMGPTTFGVGLTIVLLLGCQPKIPNALTAPSGQSTTATAKFVAALTHTPVRSNPHGITYANGKIYVCNNDPAANVVTVMNATTGAVVTTITVGMSPTNALTSQSGNLVLVTNDASNSLSVIDATTDTVKGTSGNLGNNPFKIVLTPDDKTAYISLTGDPAVAKVDLTNPATPLLSKTIAVDTAADDDRSITLLDDYVAEVNPKGNTLTLIARTNDATSSITVGLKPTTSALGTYSDGTTTKRILVVCNSGSNTVSLIDLASKTVTKSLDVGTAPVDSVAVGKYVYVSNTGSNTVSVIDTQAGAVAATIAVGLRPFHVFAAPVGGKGPASQVWVGNDNSTFASIIDTASNTVYATVGTQSGHHKMAFTPDGTRAFITNIASNSVSVIDRNQL